MSLLVRAGLIKINGSLPRRSYVTIPTGFLPDLLVKLPEPFRDELPWLFSPEGDIELGPIPAGTPVGLLGNLDLRPTRWA